MRTMTLVSVSTLVLGLSAGAAQADQCAYVDRGVAEGARQLLADPGQYLEYCEPCGDPAPGQPKDIGKVTVEDVGKGFRELYIDGKPIDLAYTYVPDVDGPGIWTNLASLAGCPADGVSLNLQTFTATDDGVLIMADEMGDQALEPEPAYHDLAEESLGAGDPGPDDGHDSPAMATPPVVVYVQAPGAWSSLVLVGFGGLAATCAFMFLMLMRTRSPRPHVPRALAIEDPPSKR